MTGNKNSFHVNARVLRLLGDQLIRDAGLAVFELVKNAYDADATECAVSISSPLDTKNGHIIIQDNGSGMSLQIIQDVWMVIGTDYRAKQREQLQRTPKYQRFPLGEKGLGRFAVHKLGKKIKLVTRQRGDKEVVVEINWDEQEEMRDLSQTEISVSAREPEIFKGNSHGTRIEVEKLREPWSRAKARNLQRAVASLCSPYEGPSSFNVKLTVSPQSDWIEGVLLAKDVQQCALYHVRGSLEGSYAVYDYRFIPPPTANVDLKPRHEKNVERVLQKRDKETKKWVPLNLSVHKIGRINFDFYIFDREPSVLHAVTEDFRGLKSYLDTNGGVRIYREGIRVWDFGEPGNDWLNLDARRVNKPTVRTSNNQILGVVLLSAEKSVDLVEKSNREGFVENTAYADLQDAVISVLNNIEADKQEDQLRVRQFFSRRGARKGISEEFDELRDKLKKRGILESFEPQIKRIEKQLSAYQDTMVRAALPGLGYASMIHGAEKILKELVSAVHHGASTSTVVKLVDQLDNMIARLGNLVRGSGTKTEKASDLIEDALFNVEFRFKAHGIIAVNGLSDGGGDFKVKCTRRLVVGSLTNLLDNAIYWLQFSNSKKHKVFVGATSEIPGGPCLIVADNGPGFQDEPEALVQPFFSRKPDGMGLGLYLIDEVMRLHGGRLLFPQHGDTALPKEFAGAIVALQFPEGKI